MKNKEELPWPKLCIPMYEKTFKFCAFDSKSAHVKLPEPGDWFYPIEEQEARELWENEQNRDVSLVAYVKLEEENQRLRNVLEKYAEKEFYIETSSQFKVFDYAHYLSEPWLLAKEALNVLDKKI